MKPLIIHPTVRVKSPGLENNSISELLSKYKHIPVSRECAHELIKNGAKEQFMMRMYKSDSADTYCYAFLPEADIVLAFGIFESVDLNDELALTVSLISSLEARAIFIQDLK